jgi:hypothetical protein
MPLSKLDGRCSGRVEGYDASGSTGTELAQRVQKTGIIVTIDGRLHDDDVVETYGGLERKSVVEAVCTGAVHCGRIEGVPVWIDHMHV